MYNWGAVRPTGFEKQADGYWDLTLVREDDFVGKWKPTSVVKTGSAEKIQATFASVTITQTQWTFNQQQPVTYGIKIDATKNPNEIDFHFTTGNKDRTGMGLIKREGNK